MIIFVTSEKLGLHSRKRLSEEKRASLKFCCVWVHVCVEPECSYCNITVGMSVLMLSSPTQEYDLL